MLVAWIRHCKKAEVMNQSGLQINQEQEILMATDIKILLKSEKIYGEEYLLHRLLLDEIREPLIMQTS